MIAVHEERTAIEPRSVVSRMSSVEIPSTPKKYWTPIEGIQGAFSTNWKPSAERSNQNHRGRLTRKPRRAMPFAAQRTAFSFSLPPKAGRRRRSAPTRGV